MGRYHKNIIYGDCLALCFSGVFPQLIGSLNSHTHKLKLHPRLPWNIWWLDYVDKWKAWCYPYSGVWLYVVAGLLSKRTLLTYQQTSCKRHSWDPHWTRNARNALNWGIHVNVHGALFVCGLFGGTRSLNTSASAFLQLWEKVDCISAKKCL